MVCSPHQYTLQKIATPYLPAAAYVEQKNYLQKSAYQSMPQLKLYTARQTDIQETATYRPQQYAKQYQTQNDERRQNREENGQFIAPVWAPTRLESSSAIPEPPLSSTWNDYGLPLYFAPRIVKEIDKPQLQEPTMKRDDLMQRIQQELAAMNIRNTEKKMEDYLCAA